MSQPAASALLSGPRYFKQETFTTNEVEAEPALCVAEIPGADDARCVKGVRFNVDERDNLHLFGLKSMEKHSILGPLTRGSAWRPGLRQGREPYTLPALWTDSRDTAADY